MIVSKKGEGISMVKATLVSSSSVCLAFIILTPLILAQKPAKKYPTSSITQKNNDGTVSTITTDGHGFTEKETRDKDKNFIDSITTKPDNTYGEGGTKVTVSSAQDKPQIEGPAVKTRETIEEYKNKSGTVRHRELSDHILPRKYSMDFGEDGKPTNFVESGLFGGRVFLRIKHDYDKSGRPLTTTVELRDDPGEPLEKYRISYKYNGDDDKQGTPTVEKYNEINEKWEETKDIGPHYVKLQEAAINEEAARVIRSTERNFDLTEDLGPTPMVDIGGDSKKNKETSENKGPSENKEPSKTKSSPTPSTHQQARPRRAAAPPRTVTGPARARGANDTSPPASAGIPKCLAGSWISESYTITGTDLTRDARGITLTMKQDGEVVVNYSPMSIMEEKNPMTSAVISTSVWRGMAKGYLAPLKQDIVKVVSVGESDLTQENSVYGRTKLSGLGPVLAVTNAESNYTCSDATLQLQTRPFTFSFKRQE
jgi:hypothetical protein